MIPLSDHNPLQRLPIVTIGLIVACVWIFVAVQPAKSASPLETTRDAQVRELEFTIDYAAVPCEVTRQKPLTENEFRAVYEAQLSDQCLAHPAGKAIDPNKHIYLAIFYSMFLHGGWLHLGGNMLFLWIFGNNVEDRIGRFRYLLFYLAAGFLATLGHVIAQPNSALAVVGASGAIAGVMGAYLVLFPTAWVRAWLLIWVGEVPAAVFLVIWFVSQFFLNPNSGVAWVAHVTGFVFGAIGGLWFRGTKPARPDDPESFRLSYD